MTTLVLGRSFQMTIEEILQLDTVRENICYNLEEIQMFQSIALLDTWGLTIQAAEKLTLKEVILDYTFDCRSRDLNIILYENKPFALYQYIGRGDMENEVIFNKEVYLKFLKDYMNEYIELKNDFKVVSTNDNYTVNNYDFGIFIKEGNAISSICKTKLQSDGVFIDEKKSTLSDYTTKLNSKETERRTDNDN